MLHLLLAIIYLSFISLGLPDSVLGSAWPAMYPALAVPVSFAGIISMIISIGTIASSLRSDYLTRRLGPGRVMVFSVALTALALLGFSLSSSFWALCLWAIPYGLGAGSVDAALNNYVAVHYASRHMSWLHCMWGFGASIGPYIMSAALTGNGDWHTGYRHIAMIQAALTAVLLLSLPLWKGRGQGASGGDTDPASELSIRQVFSIPGAKSIILAFLGYCALEQTAILWASSYLVLHNGLTPQAAAGCASLFLAGLTVGRGLNGFLTFRLSDSQLIRVGCIVIAAGVAALLLPLGQVVTLAGLVVMGLGCAPIYPCIIHSTPEHFGAERSQAVIGIQMAAAYTGSLIMPPLFGLLANQVTPGLFPIYLLLLLVLMVLSHEALLRRTPA